MNELLTIGFTNAVLATVLAVIVFLLSRRIRHAPFMRSLWLLVILKFIVPPIWTVEWAVMNETQSSSPNVWSFPSSRNGRGNPLKAVRKVSRNQIVDTTTENRIPPLREAQQSIDMPWTFPWKPTILTIWFAGTVIWMLLSIARVVTFRRLLRRAEPAPIVLQNITRRLARQFQLNEPPHVLVVSRRIPPLLCGLRRRPVIVFPAALLEKLDLSQQETVITHELAHLCRGDRWVRLLETFVLALYWWHPVAKWACRQLRESEETCCDGWVLKNLPGSSKSYARSLLETVEFLSPQRPVVPPIASGFGSVTAFKRRLEMVLQKNTLCQTSWRQRGILMFFGAAALVLSIAFVPEQPALAQQVGEVEVPSKNIHSVSFSADGQLLAGGSFDSTVKIWNAKTGELLRTLEEHKKTIRTVAFAPEGSLLASGSDDRTVILSDAKTGKRLRTLEGFEGDLNVLKFSSDGKMLWAAGENLTSWDVEAGKKMSTIKLNARNAISLDLSPDNDRLAVTSFNQNLSVTARIFDTKRGELIQSFGGKDFGVYAACFTPDGKSLAGTSIGREEGPKLHFWNIETGEIQQAKDLFENEIWALKYSPNGKWLASGGEGPVVETFAPRGKLLLSELTIWDPVSAQVQVIHQGALGRLTSLCFSPDNNRLSYCDGATVSVIDVMTGDEIWTRNY